MLGLLMTGCAPVPSFSNSPSGSQGAGATSAAPVNACPKDGAWATVAAFPPGFTGNGGIAVGPCAFLIVGELIERGTGAQRALVLGVVGAAVEVRASFEARRLWDVIQAPSGDVWAAGEDVTGSGLLVRSSGETWGALPVPAEIGWIYRLGWAGDRLLAASAGPAGQALLSAYSSEDGWQLLATIRSPASEVAPLLEPPSLRGIAALGGDVAVGGTDGLTGIVLVSDDAAASFNTEPMPDDIVDVVTNAFPTRDGLTVAGYVWTGREAYAGLLAQRDATGWREVPLPERSGRIRDAAVVDDTTYLIIEVPDGESLVAVTGETVNPEPLNGANLMRLIPGADSISVLGTNLYSRSLP